MNYLNSHLLFIGRFLWRQPTTAGYQMERGLLRLHRQSGGRYIENIYVVWAEVVLSRKQSSLPECKRRAIYFTVKVVFYIVYNMNRT